MRISLILTAGLVVAACATPRGRPAPPPPPKPAPPPDPRAVVASLRAEAEALLRAQTELYWKNWTTGAAIDVAATYAGHEALFSLDSIRQVIAAEKLEADPAEDRALRFFELYLDGEHIAKQAATLTDQVANLEGSSTVQVDGKGVAYRNLDVLLANEPSHARRLALYQAALPVIQKLSPLLEKKEALTEQWVKDLGYPSYNALAARMRDADLDQLAATAEKILGSTESLYRAAMGRAVHQELDLDLGEMRRADIPRFFHGALVTSAFPSDQMLPRLEGLLLGMGIDLKATKSIQIDDRSLPKKNPRAVCFPVTVPGDVRLSIKPQGGVDDYQQLFHEAGHALHFAFTTTPVWAFQQLGNNTVTEAYAFLLEDRLEDPRYLRELGMTGELLDGYVRSAAVKKLYMLRRYAAKVLFEKAWHGGARDPRALYQRLLSRGYGFPVTAEDAERYLVDHDDFFYSADYLRAWFLAAQIDDALTRKLGERWWHDPRAGETLRGLWAHGSELSADEVAQALGAPGLDTGPLLDRLAARIK